MDIPKKRGRGRPKKQQRLIDTKKWSEAFKSMPISIGEEDNKKQQRTDNEVDRQIDKLMKIMEFKLIENSLNNTTSQPIEKEKEEEGDFLHLKGRMGSNNYDIKVKTLEDQRMATSLLNQFGIYLIRKDH